MRGICRGGAAGLEACISSVATNSTRVTMITLVLLVVFMLFVIVYHLLFLCFLDGVLASISNVLAGRPDSFTRLASVNGLHA